MFEERISPDLHRILATQPPDAKVPIIMEFDANMVVRTRRSPFLAAARPLKQFPFTSASVSLGDLQRLAEDPAVLHVWPDLPVYALLDVSVPLIRAPQVWREGITGKGVRVAVVDTGIDWEHPDFEGRIGGVHSVVGDDGRDHFGHGTHVAGIIAGSGKASNGRYKGVAPDAILYSAKALKDNGSGMSSDVMAGLEWAAMQKAQVINLSLGTPGPCDGTDAISYFCDKLVRERGIVVVAAAGNSGPRASTVGSPGCAHEVITVGATDDLDRVAGFSSRGPTKDGRTKPDICFPGVNIIAARAHGVNLGPIRGEYYMELSGTSMATPHAAGVVALLLEADPDMKPAEVKKRLTSTAVNLGLDPNTQGAGRGDALAALKGEPAPTPQPTPAPTPTPAPVPPGGGCLITPLRRG